jgi:hypothetical protein
MKTISFKNFWPNFNYKEHTAFNWIVDYFNLQVVHDLADIVIYCCLGPQYSDNSYKHTKVFFTGEQIKPDLNLYDFSFSFEHMDDPRNFRFPLYLWHHGNYFSLKNRPKKDWAKEKTKFCNFLYGNGNENMDGVKRRIWFFKELQKYKHVDSAGLVLNNTGYHIPESKKIEWLKDYKFTIAFENQMHSGYTTEKLIQPLMAGSLPIYNGNNTVYNDFNTKSFINTHEYNNLEEVIEQIIKIDLNDDLYNDIMNTDILLDPFPEWSSKEWYINCWQTIINHSNSLSK